ncbi:MAG: glycosyltransferase [Breznakibacter sp.]|nr:glycosyltransferase [Breznakibacter sp.]
MLLSIIVPVYDRPQEINELLESLIQPDINLIEIIVVEDGSTTLCDDICNNYLDKLNIRYYFQNNTGPGLARNNGADKANGEYLLFLDSDCIAPVDFISNLLTDIKVQTPDCWGGPDAAHPSFTTKQKAINYSMTSLLTTGGIRGSKKAADKFYPRSFNMGVKKEVFKKMNGFADIRFGEDLDLSMRILEAGFKTQLFETHFVYHKRRNTFKSFFKQVYNSGKARIFLNNRHKGSLKLVHLLPTLFFLYSLVGFPLAMVFPKAIFIILIPAMIFYIDAFSKTHSIRVAGYAIIASYTQLCGYGIGFIDGAISHLLKTKNQYRFKKSFYKE